MTRIFDLAYGQVQEFLKGLAHAGLTQEEMLHLKSNPRAMREWVATLSSIMSGDLLDTTLPVATLFSVNDVRIKKLLENEFIKTVDDLTDWTYEDLRSINNCGEKTIDFIQAVLKDHGLSLSHRTLDESVKDQRIQSKSRAHAVRWWPRHQAAELPIGLFVPLNSPKEWLGIDARFSPDTKVYTIAHRMSNETIVERFGEVYGGEIIAWIRKYWY